MKDYNKIHYYSHGTYKDKLASEIDLLIDCRDKQPNTFLSYEGILDLSNIHFQEVQKRTEKIDELYFIIKNELEELGLGTHEKIVKVAFDHLVCTSPDKFTFTSQEEEKFIYDNIQLQFYFEQQYYKYYQQKRKACTSIELLKKEKLKSIPLSFKLINVVIIFLLSFAKSIGSFFKASSNNKQLKIYRTRRHAVTTEELEYILSNYPESLISQCYRLIKEIRNEFYNRIIKNLNKQLKAILRIYKNTINNSRERIRCIIQFLFKNLDDSHIKAISNYNCLLTMET